MPFDPHRRREQEVWQGPSGDWFKLQHHHPVHTFDPTALFPEPKPVATAPPRRGQRSHLIEAPATGKVSSRAGTNRPPPGRGPRDTRTAHLIAALAKAKSLPQHFVYISTTGVYGDCAGAWIDETHPLHPQTARAQRRVDAERRLRDWGRRSGVRISVLRAPGIYSAERLPLQRLREGTPALQADEDAYTNHVHADDLARMAVAALSFGAPGRVYNASDDSALKMGDYFDLVADRFGLPRPPRVSRAEAAQRIAPNLLSFMGESRRLSNHRIKRELRLKLRYPTVGDGVPAGVASGVNG